MKAIIYCFLLFTFFQAKSQAEPNITFYDYQWKVCEPLKARFFSEIKKTDSGWLRQDYFIANKQLQMSALYEDSACNIFNGNAQFYYPNGMLSKIGRLEHNKREGICMAFYSNGVMMDSALYHNNIPVGFKFTWHPNGFISDSIGHRNDSIDVKVTWFDDGTPSSSGFLLQGKLHNKWKFFHPNGELASAEVYDKGKLVEKTYYDEAGHLMTDTTNGDREAAFKGGLKGWKKYLEKKLYWPNDYQFNDGNVAVVVLQFTVNETGIIENAEVITPFHPAFDKIALETVQQSPAWTPAKEHNRFVKYRMNQNVTFQQP